MCLLLLALGVGFAAVGGEANLVAAVCFLYEESLVGLQVVVVVAWAVSLIARAVPHGDRCLEVVVVKVIEARIGVAHEVPAGIGSIVADVFHQRLGAVAAKGRMIEVHHQYARCGRLEDVALACR